jgi:hypothetical protein
MSDSLSERQKEVLLVLCEKGSATPWGIKEHLNWTISKYATARQACEYSFIGKRGGGGVMVGFGLCVGKKCSPLFPFVFVVFKILYFSFSYRSFVFLTPFYTHSRSFTRLKK